MSGGGLGKGLGALIPTSAPDDVFRYDDDTTLRVIAFAFGTEPGFVAADVARALGYRDAANMTRRLDAEDMGTRSVSTPGGVQQMAVISEAGLYVAILGSQIESAREFKRWITHTVLPEIRRTGGYAPPRPGLPMTDDELVLHALQIQQAKITTLTEKVAQDAPKVAAFDELMEADGTYSLLAASKILGWGRNTMVRELKRLGVLQGNRLPYQRYAHHHFKVVPQTYTNRKNGQTVPTATTYVRPCGLEFLRKKLVESTLAPAIRGAVDA